MKIVEIIPNLHGGGAERFVCELSNEFTKNNDIECVVVSLYKISDIDKQLVSILNPKVRILSLDKKKGLDIKLFYRLYNLLKIENPDVLHAHVMAIKYILLSTVIFRKIKYFATIHSDAYFEANNIFDKFIRMIMFRLNLCKPITISEPSKQSFYSCYKLNSHLIYNGISSYSVNPNFEYEKKDGEILLIHPASCQPVKNQKLLFSAFNKIASENSNVKLLWFGSNKNFIELFDELRNNYFNNQLIYMGVSENIRDYLSVADGMCLSSKMEGMPMTIIESFSVGCIPICTPVGGCNDIIKDGFNGLLSSGLNTSDYYNVLDRFLKLKDEEKKSIKRNSFCSFENYNIKIIAKQYLDYFKV